MRRPSIDTVDAIITINEFGIIQSFNRSAEHIFQYPEYEVLGQNVKMLMPEAFCKASRSLFAELSQHRRSAHHRHRSRGDHVRKNGETFPADLAVSRISHRDKIVFVGMIRDISERKRNEQLKRFYLHDEPRVTYTLTSISGSLALIASGTMGAMPEPAVSLLNIARNNVNRLGRPESTNCWTWIRSCRAKWPELKVHDVLPLIERTVKDIDTQIQSKQLRALIRTPDPSLKIRVDGERFSACS